MDDHPFPMSVEEIEAWLEDHFVGTPQRVRVRQMLRPDGTGILTIQLCINPGHMLIRVAPPPEDTIVIESVLGTPDQHRIGEPSDLPEELPAHYSRAYGDADAAPEHDLPEDLAGRCEVAIARAQLERAEDDLGVVTRRLPGPPEQQAEARARVKAAREDLLVKEAALIVEGFDRRR